MQTLQQTENYLRIANWRGRKSLLDDIKKAQHNMKRLWVELAASPGFDKLKEIDATLQDIIEDNS